jgi:hypothetical protein
MRIISDGLQAGDRVITKGLQRVKPGQKVEAEVAEAEAPKTTVRKPVTRALPSRTRPVSMPQPGGQPRRSQER